MNFSPETTNIMLIGAAELLVLCLFICFFLAFKNRSLTNLVGKLRKRMQALVSELQKERAANSTPSQPEADGSYGHFLNQQISATKDRHQALDPSQDIVLDIDPATPLPRRVAALRFAILQAEREGTTNSEPNWAVFQSKYEQLFSFFQDYASDEEGGTSEDIALLKQEIGNANKRVSNLEKFKTLYFDLEEAWKNSKSQADKNYSQLSEMIKEVDDSETYEHILNEYHAAYSDMTELFDKGLSLGKETKNLDEAHDEILHLRAVAAEQHVIISDLQRKLEQCDSAEEASLIAEQLKGELERQIRFVQESETCIKLMEDELNSANTEIEKLRTQSASLASLKAEIAELKESNEEYDNTLYSLQADNRRLTKKLEAAKNNQPADASELPKYKKALSDLQGKYIELEEKFLDLKLKQ